MPVPVHGVAIAIGKVIAMNVIDVSVIVIIDPVAWNLTRISPHVSGQIRVVIVHAGIDHGDNHIPTADGFIPGFDSTDVGAGLAPELAAILHGPQLAEQRIVGLTQGFDLVIGLSIEHRRIHPQSGQLAGQGLPVGNLDPIQRQQVVVGHDLVPTRRQ